MILERYVGEVELKCSLSDGWYLEMKRPFHYIEYYLELLTSMEYTGNN